MANSFGNNDFFTFPHPVNSSVVRSVAICVVVLSSITIIFDLPWIMLFIAYGFIARVLAGPRLSPLAMLSLKVIVPIFKLPYKPIPGPPKRFAATIGIVVSIVACILEFAFQLTTAAYVTLGILIFAAALEGVFGYCIGCKIFEVLMKVGVIPNSVCEKCSNLD